MLQVKDIIDNKARVIEGLKKRNIATAEELINSVIDTYNQQKTHITSLEKLQAESNSIAKTIGQLMKEGKKDEAEKSKQRTNELKQEIAEAKALQEKSEEELTRILYTIPNVPNSTVPNGKTPEDNEVVFSQGEIPKLHEGAVPHWDLLKKYKLVDFEVGVKITGAGFPVFKGKGAQLNRALINFFLAEAAKAGYEEIIPPLMVNEASGYGTGQLPDKEGQMYHVQIDDLYLIPTAEVPITNLYRDEIVSTDALPIKNVGYTPCFRREAGSYGKDVRGLNRLHQFDKVEIVQIQHPDKSYQTLEEMVEHVKGLVTKLGLPFRILKLCGGDMGFTSALTYDFEVYSAAQQKWLEVSSVSNFETFQANRLKLRFKQGQDKPQLAHTLNGSALALPRILAALLENNQTADGINIPEVLHPYLNFKKID
ncbi:MAG: serine--tRNA ligase [Flavobacteriales bacterium]